MEGISDFQAISLFKMKTILSIYRQRCAISKCGTLFILALGTLWSFKRITLNFSVTKISSCTRTKISAISICTIGIEMAWTYISSTFVFIYTFHFGWIHQFVALINFYLCWGQLKNSCLSYKWKKRMHQWDYKLNMVARVCNLEGVHKMNQGAHKFVVDNLHPFYRSLLTGNLWVT